MFFVLQKREGLHEFKRVTEKNISLQFHIIFCYSSQLIFITPDSVYLCQNFHSLKRPLSRNVYSQHLKYYNIFTSEYYSKTWYERQLMITNSKIFWKTMWHANSKGYCCLELRRFLLQSGIKKFLLPLWHHSRWQF